MKKETTGAVWKKMWILSLMTAGIFLMISCQGPVSFTPSSNPPQATEPSKPPSSNSPQPVISENNPSAYSAMVSQYLIPKAQRVAAKDFQLPTLDGNSLQLSSLKGTVVLIDFTTTWCYFCKQQAPHLEKLYTDYHQQSFEILSIYCKEAKEAVLSEYPTGKYKYPILLDSNGSVSAQSYGLQGYPLYILLDKQGNIAYTQSGYDENMYGIVSQLIETLNSEA